MKIPQPQSLSQKFPYRDDFAKHELRTAKKSESNNGTDRTYPEEEFEAAEVADGLTVVPVAASEAVPVLKLAVLAFLVVDEVVTAAAAAVVAAAVLEEEEEVVEDTLHDQ